MISKTNNRVNLMTLDFFILFNDLQPADAIVVKKNPYRLLDHYIIYLGKDTLGQHVFIANYTKGTKLLYETDLAEFSTDFVPERIVRFKGNTDQRRAAVQRALSRKDQSSYHLLVNNCEHFSTYVQTGHSHSQQATTFGTSLVITGLITAASSKNDGVKAVGFIATALGLMTLLSKD
jgi:hypothetical protein